MASELNFDSSSNDSNITLQFISELTGIYDTAALQNEKKLQRLGFTSEDLKDMSTKSGLAEVVSIAHNNGTADLLLSGYCFVQKMNNLVFQSIKEKGIQSEIIEMIFRLQHEIKDLQENNLLLERELDNLNRIQDLPRENHFHVIEDLGDQVNDYENRIEALKGDTTFSTHNENTDNRRDIIEGIKKMDKDINGHLIKIEQCTSLIAKKYKGLPSDVLLSKKKLADLKQQKEKAGVKLNKLLQT